jgi:histidinol-phosphate phosphatase family protein
VFLDRDGTMVHDVGYLSRRQDLRWYPFTVDAVRLLNRAGFAVCVTTNQGGIGLGFTTEAFVRSLHLEMHETIAAAGGHIDGWYVCPHHPRAVTPSGHLDPRGSTPAPPASPCHCRKPATGMPEQAARELGLDLRQAFVVGDKRADVGMARAIGGRGLLVQTGYGALERERAGEHELRDVPVVANLMEAVSWILDAGRRA